LNTRLAIRTGQSRSPCAGSVTRRHSALYSDSHERDLTRGGVPGHLLAMSVPVMLGFLAQTLYDLVDLFWIGRLPGPSALAGSPSSCSCSGWWSS
jgi:hypothetical protein